MDWLSDWFDGALNMRKLMRAYPKEPAANFVQYCMAHGASSQAQLFQDLFVLFMLRGKRNGFFVEFGATNGVEVSNTYLLETKCGWSGILAEPARIWHEALDTNRKAKIDHRAVWNESGKTLTFNEVEAADLSTIAAFSDSDEHREKRRSGKNYDVESVSLNDLLAFHDAPKKIDYMSVDTEGSELEILRHFDFDRYDVSVFTVEHNSMEPLRGSVHALLISKGYVRLFEDCSRWDDWYVKRAIADALV